MKLEPVAWIDQGGTNAVMPDGRMILTASSREWSTFTTPLYAIHEGYVVVPKEPTEAMLANAMKECAGIGAGCYGEHSGVDCDDMRSVWEAMIAAREQ